MKPVLYQNHHIESLKAFVLSVAGIQSMLPADCYALSVEIAAKTGNRISETTLKRIFGFTAATNHRPSLYTLNVLSTFAGFADWDAFCQHADRDIAGRGAHPSWAEVRTAATKISHHHAQGNRYQCGIPYEFTIKRGKLDQYLDQFISTDCTICMVDGNTGAGKTVGITQWVERRIHESAHDIVLFTSSHAILHHLLLGYDGNRWLANILDLVSPDLIDRFMAEHSGAAPGKFFLVVDEARYRFERQPPNHTVFAELVNMVSYFSRYPWFRFIVVLRSTTFDLYHRHYENLMAKPQWFIGQRTPSERGRDRVVQAFSDAELRQLLKNIQGNAVLSAEVLPPELDALRLPRLFQYYYEMTEGHPLPFKADSSVLFGVYHRYITRLINAISMGMDTQLLVEKLVNLVAPGDEEYCVAKRKAIMLIKSNRTCYQALLNSGLVEEVVKQGDTVEQPFLRFQSEMVLSYFIALSQIEQGEAEMLAELNVTYGAAGELVRQWIAYFKAQRRSYA